jgi:hypothetical protein
VLQPPSKFKSNDVYEVLVSRFPALLFHAFPTLLQVIFEDDQEEKDVVSRKVRLCHDMLKQTSQIRVFIFIVL